MMISVFAAWGLFSIPAAALPKATFILPVEKGITLEWVLKPMDDASESKSAKKALKFLIDPNGRPWFASGVAKLLVNPGADASFAVTETFNDAVWLPEGDIFTCSERALGSVILPENSVKPAGDDGLALAKLAGLAPMPYQDCRLFAGDASGLYVAGRDLKTGLHELQVLKGGRSGLKGEKLLAAKTRINAVAGDGKMTFIAGGSIIYRLPETGSAPVPYFDAKKPVTGLAYSAKAGLFYATADTVGFVSPDFQLEFLRADSPEIVLRGATLFIRLAKTLAVVKVNGADKFKTVRWPSATKKTP